MLGKAGLFTSDDLLDTCADKKGRKAMAGVIVLTESQLLEWMNRADPMRISGVSKEY